MQQAMRNLPRVNLLKRTLLLLIFVLLCLNGVRLFFRTGRICVTRTKRETTFTQNSKGNRTKVTKEICQRYGLDKEYDYKSLKASKRFKTVIVDDQHKTLFCYLPKVASGSWKKIFLVLKGAFQDVNDIEPTVAHKESLLKTLGDSTSDEIRKKIQQYASYTVVREPMSRLLSAYINKIYYDYTGKFNRLFGEKIKNYSRRVVQRKKDKISFEEFVEFLTKAPPKEAFELHWERMHKLCNPCLINYTIIGKYENLLQDAQVIIENVARDASITFPKYTRVQDTKALMESYFSQITESQLERLFSLYKLDYILFDYPKPLHLFNVVKNGKHVKKDTR